jgi:hypothetical protein
MKIIYKILGLAIIDFVLIWRWVYQMDPDPSVSIGIIILVPLVFVLNVIIAGVLLCKKERIFKSISCKLCDSITFNVLLIWERS